MLIRLITPEDKGLVISLRKQVSDIADAYRNNPDFVDFSWEQDLASTTEKFFLAFADEEFVGMGNLQNLNGDYIEIGVDIVPEFQHRGYGTTLTSKLIQHCRECYPDREIRMRARKDNVASIRMIEKNGGVYIHDEDTPGTAMLEKVVEMYPEKEAEYADIIESGKNGVKVFCMLRNQTGGQ